jgi:hypothetical protein
LLRAWLKTKCRLHPDKPPFPVSGRKTHKMIRLDLAAARKKGIENATQLVERERREKPDFLRHKDQYGRFADFHAVRHFFIKSLERAGISPKLAHTLARHSDIRLTLGVYTHVELGDRVAAIGALGAPG